MADTLGRPYPLRWSGGYFEAPVWPHEPDIDVIKSLAACHLQEHVSVPLDESSLEVSFFAEGAFNKLYEISGSGLRSDYLLRVTLPVEPFFKTESEVATIAFVRAKTSIPIPRIIAWNSSPAGGLGFEWILMEKMDGVPLLEVWRKIPWDRKLALLEEVAGLVNQLNEHKFNSIGGLYLKSALDGKVKDRKRLPTPQKEARNVVAAQTQSEDNKAKSVDAGHDDRGASGASRTVRQPSESSDVSEAQDFVVDQAFDLLFFKSSRYELPGDRGPFMNSLQWLAALVYVQLEWIKTGPVEGDGDYGRSFEKNHSTMESLCHSYFDTLPSVFPDDEADWSNVIYHDDLNSSNILVDPETFVVTGIVDWEMINVVPAWRATEHPKFIQDSEPFEDEEEPPIPSYDDEEDIAVYTRDRWDYRLLRNHWDATMKRLKSNDTNAVDATAIAANMECLENIPQLTDCWTRAEIWLKKVAARNEALKHKDDNEATTDVRSEESDATDAEASSEENVEAVIEKQGVELQVRAADEPSSVEGSNKRKSEGPLVSKISSPEQSPAIDIEIDEPQADKETPNAPLTENIDALPQKPEEIQTPGIIQTAVNAISHSLAEVATSLSGQTKTAVPASPKVTMSESDGARLGGESP